MRVARCVSQSVLFVWLCARVQRVLLLFAHTRLLLKYGLCSVLCARLCAPCAVCRACVTRRVTCVRAGEDAARGRDQRRERGQRSCKVLYYPCTSMWLASTYTAQGQARTVQMSRNTSLNAAHHGPSVSASAQCVPKWSHPSSSRTSTRGPSPSAPRRLNSA